MSNFCNVNFGFILSFKSNKFRLNLSPIKASIWKSFSSPFFSQLNLRARDNLTVLNSLTISINLNQLTLRKCLPMIFHCGSFLAGKFALIFLQSACVKSIKKWCKKTFSTFTAKCHFFLTRLARFFLSHFSFFTFGKRQWGS